MSSWSVVLTSNVSRDRNILPASIFDRSRIPLMSSRRCLPDDEFSADRRSSHLLPGPRLLPAALAVENDGVQRRAELVAHAREKNRFWRARASTLPLGGAPARRRGIAKPLAVLPLGVVRRFDSPAYSAPLLALGSARARFCSSAAVRSAVSCMSTTPRRHAMIRNDVLEYHPRGVSSHRHWLAIRTP